MKKIIIADANVLVDVAALHLLIESADERIVTLLISDTIRDETIRSRRKNLVKPKHGHSKEFIENSLTILAGQLSPENNSGIRKAFYTIDRLNEIGNYIEQNNSYDKTRKIKLKKDAHVIALAKENNAEIITNNLKDFPTDLLKHFSLNPAESSDNFFGHLFSSSPKRMAKVISKIASWKTYENDVQNFITKLCYVPNSPNKPALPNAFSAYIADIETLIKPGLKSQYILSAHY